MQRLFNYAFLGIIGLSLLAQTARFGLGMSGNSSAFLASITEGLGLAIVPGTALAVLKFLLYTNCSFRDAGARLLAGCYALIMLWPALLAGVALMTAVDGMTEPAADGGWRELRVPNAVESNSYLEGESWAKAHAPRFHRDCKGNDAFIRGCTATIRAQRQEQARAGADWAQQNQPQFASICRGTPDFIQGCRTWYFQQPSAARPAGRGPFGTSTTAECIVEVNANYEVMRELDLLDGNASGPELVRREQWVPDLARCEQLDRTR
jgi:hypothetical protein